MFCVRPNCNAEFEPKRSIQVYCSKRCRIIEASKRHQLTDKGKETKRKSDRRLRHTDKRKVSNERYLQSSKGRALKQRADTKYRASPEGQEAKRKGNLKYRNTLKGRKRDLRVNTLFREQHPDKAKARTVLQNTVRIGRIYKPVVCAVDGKKGCIAGHHYLGYESEHHLDVVWLCSQCHHKVHKEQLYLHIIDFDSNNNPIVESSTVYNASIHTHCQTWLEVFRNENSNDRK